MALRRCFEGGTTQARITELRGGIRRVGAARVSTRNESRASRLDAELKKMKADLANQEVRLDEHEETCERCREVREIQAELRDTTKRNAKVAQMLYGPKNNITDRWYQR